MTLISQTRRSLLLTLASAPLISACAPMLGSSDVAGLREQFEAIETASGGRLGVAAINTADNVRIGYRATERFPMCSTFKTLVAAAILELSQKDDVLLERRVTYTRADLVSHSPITTKNLSDGMTVAELCAAMVQYSDNGAANLLLRMLGGPVEITALARRLGDNVTRLDRWETDLNTAIPGDERDTTTPLAMARDIQELAVGNALGSGQRTQLQDWLRGNTTGAERIRAGVPSGWIVGDKTGTGDYGTTNDVAILWPPKSKPIILALYFTQDDQNASARSDVLVNATKLVVSALG